MRLYIYIYTEREWEREIERERERERNWWQDKISGRTDLLRGRHYSVSVQLDRHQDHERLILAMLSRRWMFTMQNRKTWGKNWITRKSWPFNECICACCFVFCIGLLSVFLSGLSDYSPLLLPYIYIYIYIYMYMYTCVCVCVCVCSLKESVWIIDCILNNDLGIFCVIHSVLYVHQLLLLPDFTSCVLS